MMTWACANGGRVGVEKRVSHIQSFPFNKNHTQYTRLTVFYHLSVCGLLVRNVSHEASETSTIPMCPV